MTGLPCSLNVLEWVRWFPYLEVGWIRTGTIMGCWSLCMYKEWIILFQEMDQSLEGNRVTLWHMGKVQGKGISRICRFQLIILCGRWGQLDCWCGGLYRGRSHQLCKSFMCQGCINLWSLNWQYWILRRLLWFGNWWRIWWLIYIFGGGSKKWRIEGTKYLYKDSHCIRVSVVLWVNRRYLLGRC